MSELKCPLCNEVIKAGQVRKEWWMTLENLSDDDLDARLKALEGK